MPPLSIGLHKGYNKGGSDNIESLAAPAIRRINLDNLADPSRRITISFRS